MPPRTKGKRKLKGQLRKTPHKVKKEPLDCLQSEKCKELDITIELKTKKPSFSCKDCNKKFIFKSSYTQHMTNEHSQEPESVGCDRCHVRCPNKQLLKQHIANVHERDVFECPNCKKQFVRQAHVFRHMAQSGCDGKELVAFPCEICGAIFSRKDNLMVHLRAQHIERKSFTCKQCPYSTHSFSKLVNHTQRKHLGISKFECHHCGKLTGTRASMTKHLEIHGEKKYACDVCSYSTYTVEVMRRHVLTHVQDKPFQCDQCNKSFIQRSQLDRHLSKHNGFFCTCCNVGFDSKAQLTAHKKDHKEKKWFCTDKDCSSNTLPFPNEGALKVHVAVHHEDRAYACEVCNKRYRTEVEMRRHVLSHTLERPRRCMYCVSPRAYVRGMQLVRHVRKAHAAVFREHLDHVRQVLGIEYHGVRVKQSELESILNVLDAEAERILQGYGEGVLYGGMQEVDSETTASSVAVTSENSPLMSEEELADNMNRLLSQLIAKDTLECFGWPDETVDEVLEKVIEHCGAKPADRDKWTRVQRLRENAKHLFLYVVEDKNIARMLGTHTIDQIIKHILTQVSEDQDDIPLNS